ncbi:MAG: hypothetical protein N3C12_01560 [Candidatus Binatia bacterium]|nr:hypothetical protein [Candidatus Binatia bacterium]
MNKRGKLEWRVGGSNFGLSLRYARIPLLLAGGVSLLAGLWAGLARAGLPLPRVGLAGLHGPLMIPGFLGTLIGLERAVGLGRRWAYLSPLASAVGTALLLLGASATWVAVTYSVGAVCLLATMISLWSGHRAWYTFLFVLGASCLVMGDLYWLAEGSPTHGAGWWLAFLIATIAAERMELSRVIVPPRWAQPALVAVFFLLVASLVSGGLGTRLSAIGIGVALVAIALWLVRFDVAWRTVRHRGLPRFVAIALLSGFTWLGVAGALATTQPAALAGTAYDAVLHAVFLGFVFSMIFAHAPMIFPSILGLRVPFHWMFYIHLAVLHVSVALRVAGDVGQDWFVRTWGVLGNAAAIVLFLAVTISRILFSSQEKHAVVEVRRA